MKLLLQYILAATLMIRAILIPDVAFAESIANPTAWRQGRGTLMAIQEFARPHAFNLWLRGEITAYDMPRRMTRFAERTRSAAAAAARTSGNVLGSATMRVAGYKMEVLVQSAQSLIFMFTLLAVSASQKLAQERQDQGKSLTYNDYSDISSLAVDSIIDSGEIWFATANAFATTGLFNFISHLLGVESAKTIFKKLLKSAVFSLIMFSMMAAASQLWKECIMQLPENEQEKANGALNRVVSTWIYQKMGKDIKENLKAQPEDFEILEHLFIQLKRILFEDPELFSDFMENAFRLAIMRGEFVISVLSLGAALVGGAWAGQKYGRAAGMAVGAMAGSIATPVVGTGAGGVVGAGAGAVTGAVIGAVVSTVFFTATGIGTALLPECISEKISETLQATRLASNRLDLFSNRQTFDRIFQLANMEATGRFVRKINPPIQYGVFFDTYSENRSVTRGKIFTVLIEKYYQLVNEKMKLKVRAEIIAQSLAKSNPSAIPIEYDFYWADSKEEIPTAAARAQQLANQKEIFHGLEELESKLTALENSMLELYKADRDYFEQYTNNPGIRLPFIVMTKLREEVDIAESFANYLKGLFVALRPQRAHDLGVEAVSADVNIAIRGRQLLDVYYFRRYKESFVFEQIQQIVNAYLGKESQRSSQ